MNARCLKRHSKGGMVVHSLVSGNRSVFPGNNCRLHRRCTWSPLPAVRRRLWPPHKNHDTDMAPRSGFLRNAGRSLYPRGPSTFSRLQPRAVIGFQATDQSLKQIIYGFIL